MGKTKYSIVMEFEFPYGHRLMKHSGSCRNVHGHNGRLIVSVTKSDPSTLNDSDMVLDFYIVKSLIRSLITSKYDHCFMLNKDDVELKNAIKNYQSSIIEFDGDPTAELIAKRFFEEIQAMLSPGHVLDWVEFCESSTSKARYERI